MLKALNKTVFKQHPVLVLALGAVFATVSASFASMPVSAATTINQSSCSFDQASSTTISGTCDYTASLGGGGSPSFSGLIWNSTSPTTYTNSTQVDTGGGANFLSFQTCSSTITATGSTFSISGSLPQMTGSGQGSCVSVSSTAISLAATVDPVTGDTQTEDPAADGTSCAVDGIGWIVCPLSRSIAAGVDSIFGIVKGFLEVKTFTSGQTGMRNAWESMRSIANVCFVIAFLMIIYSQMSGWGLTNYGIKKMLPRLIVAAILVNVSYWLCAAAVDASNVVGHSIGKVFEAIAPSAQATNNTQGATISWLDIINTVTSGVALGSVAAYTAGVAAGGFVGLLWAAVPLLISALFAIFIAFLVLAARQALLVILVVVSPLAFVAYLLPNTQKWFDKWKDIFLTLVFMYPIIAAVFGGSQLASLIILSNSSTMLEVLLAMGIQFIPLAITPLVMKFSGGVLNRLGGIANNANRGVLDKTKNYANERKELARKRGIAQGNGFINRMARRNDLTKRRRKSQGEQYESQSEARWQGSDRGRKQETATAVAQREASQRAELNKQAGEQQHLAESQALNRLVTQQQATTRAVKSAQDDNAEAEHIRDNPKLYHEMHVAHDEKKIADTESERAYAKDEDGTLQAIRLAAASGGLEAAKAVNEAMVQELKTDKGALENPQFGAEAAELKAADTEKRVYSQRAASNANIANVEYAGTIKDESTGYAEKAGGVDPAGKTRAIAAATQVIDKQLNEAIATQKTDQESHDTDTLFTTMMSRDLPAERRAAAAGLLMSRGGDQHVQEVLDYLGTVEDDNYSVAVLQKQVAADIGNRKPQGFGRTDLSLLAQGTFGANSGKMVKDKKTGQMVLDKRGFEDNLLGRLNRGKIGSQELATMGADELARLAHIIETRKGDITGTNYQDLQKSIAEIDNLPVLKARVNSPEQQKLLKGISDGTGVNAAIDLQNFDFARTRQ